MAKTVDTRTVREVVEDSFRVEEENIERHLAVLAALEIVVWRQQGNRRWKAETVIQKVAEQIEQANPTWKCSRYCNFGQNYVVIRTPYLKPGQDAPRHFVGYDGDFAEKYDVNKFAERDLCHGSAARDRNVEREALLNNPGVLDQLQEAVDAYKAAADKLETLVGYDTALKLPDRHEIGELAYRGEKK